MTEDVSTVPTWSWEHPEDWWVGLAECAELEPLPLTPPYSRATLESLGITGIEFGSWRSALPFSLSTDLIGVTDGKITAEPGRLYKVDGQSLFVPLDAREALPFEDGVFDWVYAEHFVEHISAAEAITWLTEVRRVLAPTGFARLTTPDLRRYVDSYLSAEGGFFTEHRDGLYQRGARPRLPERPAFMMNLIFYFWGHRWIYDFEELRYALGEAGFDPDTVVRKAFHEGAIAEVAMLDRETRRHETMYIEAGRAA
jgi:predicted SAM-dependent methyltransferase